MIDHHHNLPYYQFLLSETSWKSIGGIHTHSS